MNTDRVRQMLAQTLDDFRLSRSEKTVLSKIFGHVEPTSHEAALYRSIAFKLARDAMNASSLPYRSNSGGFYSRQGSCRCWQTCKNQAF